MEGVIEKERFLLRELKVTDANMFYSLNLDPEVTSFTGDSAFRSISEAMEFLENYSDYKKNGFGRWAIVHKVTGELWGWCGLKKREDIQVDLGYRLFQDKWRKGCATEVGKACIEFGFKTLNLNEIVAEAVIENKASFKVMERLGFTYKMDSKDHGMPTKVYSITRANYLNQH